MRSYLEILNELRTAIETGIVSNAEKRELYFRVMEYITKGELYFHIDELKELLLRYSN